jgi:hypothetical protein
MILGNAISAIGVGVNTVSREFAENKDKVETYLAMGAVGGMQARRRRGTQVGVTPDGEPDEVSGACESRSGTKSGNTSMTGIPLTLSCVA